MKQFLKTALFGVGVWAVPFAFGMLVFPLQKSAPALFDTLMSIGLTFAATMFGILYLRKRPAVRGQAALVVSLVWMIICLLIDFPILVLGIGMDLKSYMADIGVGYLIVPIVVVGLAYISRTDQSAGNGEPIS